jgi:uracil-DNA glycosylase
MACAGAAAFLPERINLSSLREAAAGCRGCSLYAPATQTVFGEGLKRSRLMLVGETPGDREDLTGHPFVGPAGHELDGALERAGIDRSEVYLTNAVKHFKFEERGKRRIHQRPTRSEMDACFPWLRAELDVVGPHVLLLLGAVAGETLFGSSFRVGANRGAPMDSDLAPVVLATIHPAAILRAPDKAARVAERERFTDDLRLAAEALA